MVRRVPLLNRWFSVPAEEIYLVYKCDSAILIVQSSTGKSIISHVNSISRLVELVTRKVGQANHPRWPLVALTLHSIRKVDIECFQTISITQVGGYFHLIVYQSSEG